MNAFRLYLVRAIEFVEYAYMSLIVIPLHSIRNLCRWLPVIWKDRDDDFYFTYEILKKKLNHILISIEFANGNRIQLDKIKLCIKLLELLQSEKYIFEFQDFCKCEYKFVNDENNNNLKKLEINVLKDNLEEYFKKYRLSYYKMVKRGNYILGDSSNMHIAMSLGAQNHNRAKSILFKLIDTNIEKWLI